MFLGVGDNFLTLLVRFVSIHGHLQRVHVGRLALYHGGEMSPGCPHLVGVLVVHRVLAGEVTAVLGQHLGKDNVTLVPGIWIREIKLNYSSKVSSPEYAVIGIADDVETQQSIGHVKVEDKV